MLVLAAFGGSIGMTRAPCRAEFSPMPRAVSIGTPALPQAAVGGGTTSMMPELSSLTRVSMPTGLQGWH